MGLPVKRDALGRVVAGSLNPSGRPKVDSELARAARELSPLALQVWRKTMEDFLEGNGSADDALRAANDSMARGFGRPPESVQVTAEVRKVDTREFLRAATNEELQVLISVQRRIAERAAAQLRGDAQLERVEPDDQDGEG